MQKASTLVGAFVLLSSMTGCSPDETLGVQRESDAGATQASADSGRNPPSNNPSLGQRGDAASVAPHPTADGGSRDAGPGFTEPNDVDASPSAPPDAAVRSTCGDGVVDSDEQCDQGLSNGEADGYGGCSKDCEFVNGHCGDGVVQADFEECDDGQNDGGYGECGYGCKLAARCGDGVVHLNFGERCDDGVNAGGYSECGADCQYDGYCGDGVLQSGSEECDDGNQGDDDDCTSHCKLARCGDGFTAPNEVCDDGNTSNMDGCVDDCSAVAVCGDGYVRFAHEFCDWGPLSTDACTDCQPNPGFCGNGVIEAGEECDDGNAFDDECGLDCRRNGLCGNGVVDPGEECDDGDLNDANRCSNSCVRRRGEQIVNCGEYRCDSSFVYGPCDGSRFCGDGQRWIGWEECDDGNEVSGDGCTPDCVLEYCGDGITGDDEACDDGNADDLDGCTTTCESPPCGNGIVDPGEECDDGNLNHWDDCHNNCTLNLCGNGTVEPDLGEQCDDGNKVDNDRCQNNCLWSVCGDGKLATGEQCDDGAPMALGCSFCVQSEGRPGIADPGEECDDDNLNVNDFCHYYTCNDCGDGYKSPVEGCDDGNSFNGDDCTNSCAPAFCGDGILHSDTTRERCDCGADENRLPAGCTMSNGPDGECDTSCQLNTCGNGMLDPLEECDDGNADNSDSCLDNCLWNRCGDGSVYLQKTDAENPNATEECDDGNLLNNDDCLKTCVNARCGDAVVNYDQEQCDCGDSLELKPSYCDGINGVGTRCTETCSEGP